MSNADVCSSRTFTTRSWRRLSQRRGDSFVAGQTMARGQVWCGPDGLERAWLPASTAADPTTGVAVHNGGFKIYNSRRRWWMNKKKKITKKMN
ncbi:hypothetical protein LguiA_012376 [Lonicera macranthoides]